MDGDAISRQALAAVFAQFGKTAVYTPSGGAAIDVTVLLRHPDEIVAPAGISQRGEAAMIHMLVSEVASPKRGDSIVIDGQGYMLGTPRHPDPRRLKWEVELTRT